MSQKTYSVLKPVLHDRKLYRRGHSIELSEKDAAPLLDLQHIGIPVESDSAIVLPKPLTLSPSTLGKMTLAELNDYATARGIAIPDNATKEQIITSIASPTVEVVSA